MREANRRAAQKLVELEDHWQRLKQQASPVRVTDLTPDVVTQLADYIRFCVFNADDYRRDSPQVAHRLAVMRDLAAGRLTQDQATEALQQHTEASLDAPAGLDRLAPLVDTHDQSESTGLSVSLTQCPRIAASCWWRLTRPDNNPS
jgi:hypothetical protein